jgi:protein-disulfide isomerase
MTSRFLLLLAFALAACSPAGKAPAPVDPAFAKAVHDYLIANPEVIEEAQKALADKKQIALFNEAISDKADPYIGRKDASITIVEFFDYRCPYCEHAVDWTLQQPKANEDVRVIFKEFPILSEASLEASKAALAANKQGKYPAMHRALMKTPGALTSELIDQAALSSGVNVKRMRNDMESPDVIAHLKRISKLAYSGKVESTPTFLVNGVMVTGSDEKALNEAIKLAREKNKT